MWCIESLGIVTSDPPHAWNFIQTAWELLRNALSTSNLSIVVFSICVPFIVFVATVGWTWYGQPLRTFAAFWAIATNWIRPALLGIGVAAFAWLVLGSWAVYMAVYNDHNNLAGRLRDVVNEKNRLKVELGERNGRIKALTEANKHPPGQVRGQSPTKNLSPSDQEPVPNNAQLADSARDLARRFRDLQRLLNWNEASERDAHRNPATGPIPQSFYDHQVALLQPLSTQGVLSRRQILNRLPPQPADPTVDMVLNDVMFSGNNPLYVVADYFDQLAQLLVLH